MYIKELFQPKSSEVVTQPFVDHLCSAFTLDPFGDHGIEHWFRVLYNGRIEEVLQSHHFKSGEELETTLHRYVWLYNQQLPQSALRSKSPLQAMKDWYNLKPELFKKRPYYLTGCYT